MESVGGSMYMEIVSMIYSTSDPPASHPLQRKVQRDAGQHESHGQSSSSDKAAMLYDVGKLV